MEDLMDMLLYSIFTIIIIFILSISILALYKLSIGDVTETCITNEP